MTSGAPVLARPARRFLELVALAERRLADGFGPRVARFYAWGIAVSYGLALFFTSSRPDGILLHALGTLAWIPGGLVALAAARDLERLDDDSGLVQLVRQRGFDARDLELARWLAAVRRVLRVTGWPALLLMLASGARADGSEAALASLASLLGAAAFVLSLAVVLATLARAAALGGGGRGRLLLAALVLGPHVARSLFPWVPSVPALLGQLLALFFSPGGA